MSVREEEEVVLLRSTVVEFQFFGKSFILLRFSKDLPWPVWYSPHVRFLVEIEERGERHRRGSAQMRPAAGPQGHGDEESDTK